MDTKTQQKIIKIYQSCVNLEQKETFLNWLNSLSISSISYNLLIRKIEQVENEKRLLRPTPKDGSIIQT